MVMFSSGRQIAGLNKKASQKQNAQDYQNRDDDDFDQAHNGVLSRTAK